MAYPSNVISVPLILDIVSRQLPAEGVNGLLIGGYAVNYLLLIRNQGRR
jgi:hypothetical protein